MGDAEAHEIANELLWGIKGSFVEYVLDSISDGEVALTNGAHETARRVFAFPLDADASLWSEGAESWLLRFTGSAILSGYGGELRLPIVNPWIEVQHGAAVLSIESEDGDGRLEVARGAATVTGRSGSAQMLLSYSAVELFLMRYGAGQELSSVSFDASVLAR